MAFRGGSPEDYPVIRAPPMTSGNPPPTRPPPRAVHWDDRPSYLDSPPRRGFPPGGGAPLSRYSEDAPRRFTDDSPPQRYIEGPPGYQDSPPRRFPGRRNPPPPYLSPEDSPPYRYGENAPRRYRGGPSHRPYSEDASLPADIDGPPPPGFRDEGRRRFGGSNPPGGYSGGAYRDGRLHTLPGSESPSPPPGFRDDGRQRFDGNPSGGYPGHRGERLHTFADSESPSPPPGYFPPPPPPPHGRFLDEPPRRFGASPRQFPRYADDESPPPYADEGPRRIGRGGRRVLHDGSPPGQGYENEGPRRIEGGRRVLHDGSPPGPGYLDEPPRRFGGTPPREFHDGSPEGHSVDEPPRKFSSPPGPIADSSRPSSDPPRGYNPEDPARRFSSAPAQRPVRRPPGLPPLQFPDGSPPGPQQSYAAEDPPRPNTGAQSRQFSDESPPGPAGFPEGPPRNFRNTQPRQGPDGSPSEYDTPGFGGTRGQFPDGSPGHPGTPPRRPDGPPPVGVPLPLGQPRFPPEAFAAAALGRRPSPGSPSVSPPGPQLVRYTGGEPLPLRTPDESPPDIYGGPRPGVPLASTPPGYRGGRLEPPDDFGGAPPYVTPPREPYRLPPPGLGQGGDAPLLPPGFVSPQRFPGVGVGGPGSSPPEFLFPRRHPDGYTARTPPRQPRPHDAIFTADVVPIELDDKLKEIQPHQGNPGSSTGGAWKDLWAALLFILQIAAITTFSIIFGLQGLANTIQHYNAPNSFHITDWFPQLAAAAIMGAVFACVWQNAIRMAPVLMILVTVWTGSAVMFLVGIVLIATGKSLGLIGLVFLFAGLCQALYAFVVRDRIPFAGEMLKKVVSVCNTYPSTYIVSYIFVVVALGWLALWIFGFSGSGIRPRHAAIMALFLASLVWTMQVLRNIVRVTVAGTVALFYFQENNMPRMPTYVSLARACTTSLGSICFGSFFVPLVEAPCHALRRINSQAGASEFLFSCVLCLLSCFEHLIRYFNRMGYIQVAVYGKPFVRASKDTWDMLQAQQVDVLVHDDLTSTVLFLACGIAGSFSALVGGIWTFIAHKSLTIVIALVSYLIGALISYVTLAVVESGVATYYVCFAEDPASLQRYDGPFYERMWVRQMELQSPMTELTT